MAEKGYIALAAGGTGGHVFPARALAETLVARGWRVGFITDHRGTAFAENTPGTETHRIKAASLGGGACSKLKGLTQLCVGLLQARALLRRLSPDAIVGFGGYPSVPAMLAATGQSIPSMIHEQNAVLGRANRLIAPRADLIATAYETVGRIRDADKSKIVLTGNPVRAEIRALASEPAAEKPDGTMTVLVFGGSQGARILSDVVPAAMARLPQEIRDRLSVVQQCRPEDIERVRDSYTGTGIHTTLSSFFDDIPERLKTADLVIARAGASTIAELTVAGRASILVPYRHAMDDHQTANARTIHDAGAGWMMPEGEFTPEALADRIRVCLSAPSLLTEAAQKALGCGHPDAADRLADAVERLAAPRLEAAA